MRHPPALLSKYWMVRPSCGLVHVAVAGAKPSPTCFLPRTEATQPAYQNEQPDHRF